MQAGLTLPSRHKFLVEWWELQVMPQEIVQVHRLMNGTTSIGKWVNLPDHENIWEAVFWIMFR